MGFLDDLKRQAESLKAEQSVDTELLARNTALADAACKNTLQYWLELAAQLNVLLPRPALRLSLDNRTALEGMVRSEFRVDSRRKAIRDLEVFDHVVLHGLQKSGQKMAMSKDFPPEIERLESRLRQAGITPDTETRRDPDNGKLLNVRFAFLADVVIAARLTPLHDTGRVQFKLTNFDGLETLTGEFPAHLVNTALLDELARWLMGHPHQFLQQAEHVRRIEA